MFNLKIENSHNAYDDIPVFYCHHCLSLNIRGIQDDDGLNYCDECGSTDIEEGLIEQWETLYANKFGHKYIETKTKK